MLHAVVPKAQAEAAWTCPTPPLSHSALFTLSSRVFSSSSKTHRDYVAEALSVYFTGIENGWDLQRLSKTLPVACCPEKELPWQCCRLPRWKSDQSRRLTLRRTPTLHRTSVLLLSGSCRGEKCQPRKLRPRSDGKQDKTNRTLTKLLMSIKFIRAKECYLSWR